MARLKGRQERRGVEMLLSPLEADVLGVLWSSNSMKVRDIYNTLRKKRKVALTSVAVILDRLHSRKLVRRDVATGRGGAHYIYSVQTSRNGFEQSIIETTVNKLIDNFGPTAVNYFNERFSKRRK